MSRDGFAAIEREEQQAQDERDEGNTARWDQAIKSYKDRTYVVAMHYPPTVAGIAALRVELDRALEEIVKLRAALTAAKDALIDIAMRQRGSPECATVATKYLTKIEGALK